MLLGKSNALWHATVESYFQAIPVFIRPLITSMIRVNIYRDAWGHGLVRHSPNDQIYLLKRVATALNTILGEKDFFLGNFPSECDCIAFGTISALLDDSKWPNEVADFIKTDCKNLASFSSRFKQSVFGDMKPGDVIPSSRPDFIGIQFKE